MSIFRLSRDPEWFDLVIESDLAKLTIPTYYLSENRDQLQDCVEGRSDSLDLPGDTSNSGCMLKTDGIEYDCRSSCHFKWTVFHETLTFGRVTRVLHTMLQMRDRPEVKAHVDPDSIDSRELTADQWEALEAELNAVE